MDLLKVATGLYWLEIPERDLYLMCGCPMDGIKHLENKNIIHRLDRDDVYMESGPNAILLSDLPVQNGYFCNLAEFPILHMMYKQGMVLPGHPGNKGEKPWIIGSNEQVDAQKNYIFRGNYGLAAREEFKAAGINDDELEYLWQLKMNFNFGKILDPEDLITTTVIAEEEVELRPDVFLKRTGLNRYILRYLNDSVEIDLNLRHDELYEPPYQLDFRKIKREYFSVIHTGEGNGWDNSRPCMGSIVNYKGKIYLIDAGPNIEYSLNAMGFSVNDVEGLFHTHIHDDHFAGLTYLIMADHRIKYYATPLVLDTARKKLAALMGQKEELFDSLFDPVPLECSCWNSIDGLEVKPLFSPHPVETSIFYFRVPSEKGYKSYAHLADIVSKKVLEGFVSEEPGKGISRADFDAVWSSYLEYADIKKVDVGGGMVHGDSADFSGDTSKKLILSHLDRKLSRDEKKIGKDVDFGAQDILIPSKEDYIQKQGFEILNTYFPEMSPEDLKTLFRGKTREFSPGTIIARDSSKLDVVYLILSGKVDYLFSETGNCLEMTAGSTVGLLNGLWDEPVKGTYKAAAYVEALVIGKNDFLNFLEKNNEMENLKRVSRMVFDFSCSSLFGSRISNTNLIKLAMRSSFVQLLPGDEIPGGWTRDLYLIKKGSLEVFRNMRKIGDLGKFDSWGGYPVYPGKKDHGLRAVVSGSSSCDFYRISHEVLRDIPVVQWKLYQLRSCWGCS